MECVKCKKSIPEDALFCQYCGKKQVVAPRKRKKRANGMGAVIKKPGGRAKPWEAQKNGVHIGYYSTRTEAERALADLMDTKITDKFGMTFSEIYERWKPTHGKEIGPSGMAGYATAYKQCAVLHNKTFRSLRKVDFQAVIDSMEEKEYSKSSCEKVLQLFGQLSKWAIEEEDICRKNYARGVIISAVEKKKADFVFSDEQITAILKSNNRAADIAMLLISTGCRPIDLFTAELKDCYDTYFISGSKTEAGRDRVIPVNEIGQRAYNKIKESAKLSKGSLLIDGYKGNKEYRNFAKRDWKKLMEEIGAEGPSPYDCRHTFATLAVKSEVQPEVLQKILGHASYTTTIKYYTHLDKDFVIDGSKKVAITATLQSKENAPDTISEKSSEK